MEYRIIITHNNKKKKGVEKGATLSLIKKKYFKLKDSNKVLFPKKISAYKKIHPVKYELLLLKNWEENDVPFIDRDELGRTKEISDPKQQWTIIEKCEYYYEEKFTVFNHKKRLTSIEILKHIILRKHNGIIVKQVNYLNNKLLIHQNNDLDIVLCKSPSDCKRLFTVFKDFIENNNIKNVMFTGSIKVNKQDIYQLIINKTGWKKNKIYRTTTRP